MAWAQQREELEHSRRREMEAAERAYVALYSRQEAHESDPAVQRYRAAKADPARVARIARREADRALMLERVARAEWASNVGWGNRFVVDRSEDTEYFADRRMA